MELYRKGVLRWNHVAERWDCIRKAMFGDPIGGLIVFKPYERFTGIKLRD